MKKAHSASVAVRAEGRGDAGYQVAMHLPRRTGFPKLTQQISKWHISSIEKYWVEWPWKNSNWARNGRPCTHFAISCFCFSPNCPPEDSKIQNPKSIGYGHFPRLLLALRATNSKILAPGGANTAMAYRRTNSFLTGPPLQSGERTSPRSTMPNHFVNKNPHCNFFPVLSLVTTGI